MIFPQEAPLNQKWFDKEVLYPMELEFGNAFIAFLM